MGKKTFFILSLLAVAAFFFRSYLLPSHLFFGPEQGKDFLVIRDIVVSHKMTLIGSKTDISGVFHGPLYYYLAAIPFILSKGNPLWVLYCMIALQALTVYPLFLVGKELTNKNHTGYITALLFTVSFGLVVYARWLSGPPLTLCLTVLFYLGVIRFLKGKQWYLVLSAVSFGLAGQVEFMNFLLMTATGGCIVLFYRKKFFGKAFPVFIISFVIALSVSLANFVLFDIRHEFLITKSIYALLTGNEGLTGSIIHSFWSVTEKALAVVRDLFGLPYNRVISVVVILFLGICVWFFRKNKNIFIIPIGIITPLFVLVILRCGVLEQLYLPILIPMLIWLAYIFDRVYEYRKNIGIACVIVFVILNLYTIYMSFPSNFRVFFQNPQPYVRFSDQLAVIHAIYKRADGNPFGVQAYTIPYFWQDGWTYLFWWMGTTHYTYIPREKDDKRLYVIIQKDRLSPLFQYNWYTRTVNNWGTLQNAVSFGEFTVEERIKEDHYEK